MCRPPDPSAVATGSATTTVPPTGGARQPTGSDAACDPRTAMRVAHDCSCPVNCLLRDIVLPLRSVTPDPMGFDLPDGGGSFDFPRRRTDRLAGRRIVRLRESGALFRCFRRMPQHRASSREGCSPLAGCSPTRAPLMPDRGRVRSAMHRRVLGHKRWRLLLSLPRRRVRQLKEISSPMTRFPGAAHRPGRAARSHRVSSDDDAKTTRGGSCASWHPHPKGSESVPPSKECCVDASQPERGHVCHRELVAASEAEGVNPAFERTTLSRRSSAMRARPTRSPSASSTAAPVADAGAPRGRAVSPGASRSIRPPFGRAVAT